MGQQEENENWYREKVGKRIERGTNRLLGYFLSATGAAAAYLTLSSDEFSLMSHWPGLVVTIVLLGLARLCFRSKKSVIEEFGEEPSSNSRTK